MVNIIDIRTNPNCDIMTKIVWSQGGHNKRNQLYVTFGDPSKTYLNSVFLYINNMTTLTRVSQPWAMGTLSLVSYSAAVREDEVKRDTSFSRCCACCAQVAACGLLHTQ